MTDRTREVIGSYRRSHDELVAQVAEFTADDLRRVSGSTEWSVAQVLSHLGSSAEIALSTLRAGAADPSASPSVWARWDARDPEAQAAGFVRADEELVGALEALDDIYLQSTTIDMGFLPVPVDVVTFVSFRLTEVALHRWDVEVACNQDATLVDYLVPILLNGIPPMVPMLARHPRPDGIVAFHLTDMDRTLTLHWTEHGATMTENGEEHANTDVELTGESFLRLVSGRLGPHHTPGSVRTKGELSLDQLRAIFPGY